MSTKEYLGDAVYADYDGWHFVLTTEDGIRATNEICLEPAVMQALFLYVQRIEALRRAGLEEKPE